MKQQRFKKTLLASLLTLSTGLALSAPYDIVDLGSLGGDQAYAFGINNNGTAVGYANGPLKDDGSGDREFGLHAASYINGVANDLGAFGEANSLAFKINDSEQAVGYAIDTITRESDGESFESVENFAVVYEGGMVEKLSFDEDLRNSQATNINNNGDIVGFGDLVDNSGQFPVFIRRGFVKLSDGTLTTIDDLDEELDLVTIATSINNFGKVVGLMQVVDENSNVRNRGFYYDTNSPESLSLIPFVENRSTVITDLNDSDLIVGRAQDQDGLYHAFYYEFNSGEESLNYIPYFGKDFRDATANAVNNHGDIVGNALVVPFSQSGVNTYTGFLYSDGELQDLNSLLACDAGWEIQQAQDINDAGEIVGVGIFEGEIRAYKLIPTGGAIESCEDSGSGASGGGSVPVSMIFLLGALYFLRRRA